MRRRSCGEAIVGCGTLVDELDRANLQVTFVGQLSVLRITLIPDGILLAKDMGIWAM